jgi:ABC-2 type transport system ATP-binding protein/lipopolysaccharide transport system ATP-binding protein
MDDTTISIQNVSVRYVVPRERIPSLKEYAIRRLKRRVVFDQFEALQGVSFDVSSGETVGVIGPNGSGKSTLLKLIARVLKPTTGRVVVVGRVAPLLELGLGMNAELTGRENVLLQGALMGFSRNEMRRRLERIVEFAELGEFVDSPTRTYSSGMLARLTFSVASDVDPDVLLVDEALSVGDERFALKCKQRMADFRRSGKTVLVVSHDMEQIRANCHRVVWLHMGRLVSDGPAEDVTEAYHQWSISGVESPETVVPTAVG